MKKVKKCLFIISVMAFGLSACGEGEEHETNKGQNVSSEVVEIDTELETEAKKDDEAVRENWGVNESKILEKDSSMLRAYINFPDLLGITEGSGKIAYQPDGSLVIFDGQYKNGVIDDGVEIDKIFPLYFEQTSIIIKAYKGFGFDDFEFTVTSKENVTINDYEMCKYFGKHTFTAGSKTHEMAFVAYATRLKGNNAAVYWMVLDETEDQSIGDVIESHADRMAQTLHE